MYSPAEAIYLAVGPAGDFFLALTRYIFALQLCRAFLCYHLIEVILMVHGIDTHRMIEKALQMQPSTVQFIDLMTDEEKEKYTKMHKLESDSVRWKFTEELIKRKLDRKVVLSVKLGDDTVYINQP
ncbi:hypothetical protein BU586_00290 [Staphylococcus agnetis]|nr:hypothetical protein BU586_00290 [Staphylococcus agnetis]